MRRGRRPGGRRVRFAGERTSEFTGLTFRRYTGSRGEHAGVGTVRNFIDPRPLTNEECRIEARSRLARIR